MGNREARKPGFMKQAPKTPFKLPRYQARVVLCAYIILGHPTSVFSGQGEREIALAQSAEVFVREFELLTKVVLDGPVQISNESDPVLANFRSQLCSF